MKIGQLARVTGATPETIRFYERSGLLPPPLRTEANYRDFGPLHVERLEFIRRCRALGIGLGGVRELLRFRDNPCKHCEGVNELIDERIAQVATQITGMRALQEQLEQLRATCPGDRPSTDCAILQSLSTSESQLEGQSTRPPAE